MQAFDAVLTGVRNEEQRVEKPVVPVPTVLVAASELVMFLVPLWLLYTIPLLVSSCARVRSFVLLLGLPVEPLPSMRTGGTRSPRSEPCALRRCDRYQRHSERSADSGYSRCPGQVPCAWRQASATNSLRTRVRVHFAKFGGLFR